jgi:Cu+-exporting ATPase
MSEAVECNIEIEGMDCANCAQTITKYFSNKGFKKINVDYASGLASFCSTDDFEISEIDAGLKKLGYSIKNSKTSQSSSTNKILIAKLIISTTCTVPLLLHMLLPFQALHNPVVQLIITIPVFIIGIIHFGKTAFNALSIGVFHMDLLIIIGSSAAFIYSVWGSIILYDSNYLFFETTASIITLVLFGNYIEHLAVLRTRKELTQLQKLQIPRATRINFYNDPKFESKEEVDTENLLLTDIILIRDGDIVPVDASILWGDAELDESLITGESRAINKQIGDKVLAGSTLINGTVKCKVEALKNNSTLSNIIKLVSDTQKKKPRIQKLADRITQVFVPVVLSISAFAFLINFFLLDQTFAQSLLRSIAVLVISCPCAMGLATPTAVMVGLGRAAKNGILIKDSEVLESFSKINMVIFDKTGTLTNGKFTVSKIETFNFSEVELLNHVISIEKFSSHPIAKSLLENLCSSINIQYKSVNEVKGIGMIAIDMNGNMFELTKIENNLGQGISIYKNKLLIGNIYFSDILKPEAKAVINYFKSMNIESIIISGDKNSIVESRSNDLGISNYYSEKLPLEKLEIISKLEKKNNIMMIGDGINDAPALARAKIGVSLSKASNINTDAAQVVLLNSNIGLLPQSYQIGKLTYITIKQNLFWAFFYNIIAIPLAAMGFLSPTLGALTMALSDVIVIGNSIRLRYRKLDV